MFDVKENGEIWQDNKLIAKLRTDSLLYEYYKNASPIRQEYWLTDGREVFEKRTMTALQASRYHEASEGELYWSKPF
jgi:hypothetical protein